MVKYEDSGRAHRRQHSRHRPKRQPIDAVSVFSLSPSPSLLLRLFLSRKRKSRTSWQPIALAFGPLSAGWSKEIIRELVKIVHIAEDDHENFGEARVAGRASLVSASLWWDGRLRRTIEACLTFPEWVQGKNRKKTVVATKKKVDWAAKKLILDRRKNFRWVVVQSGTSEKKTNQK